LVGQLIDLGILKVVDLNAYGRRIYAPSAIDTLTRRED